MGDPFLLGEDIYRRQDLPGGPFRKDVCRLEAEVLEVRTRRLETEAACPAHHADGLARPAVMTGCRRRALLDMGRFHGATDLVAGGRRDDDGLTGLSYDGLPGAFIAGLSAGYLVLDVTNCRPAPAVGQTICFRPRYWALAAACRHPAVTIALREEGPGRAAQT
jgi:predicted amino acid racemase